MLFVWEYVKNSNFRLCLGRGGGWSVTGFNELILKVEGFYRPEALALVFIEAQFSIGFLELK